MRINDYDFKMVEQGRGETLIFVHGSVSDYRTWIQQQDFFSKFFHTIIYSRRFHWPNAQISESEDYAMYQHVDDLAGLIRRQNKTVHLVGHSYGGFICLLLAMKSPELIKTLVLSEPPVITLFVSNHPKPLEIFTLLLSRPRTALALIKLGRKGMMPAQKEMERDNIEKAIELFGKATLGSAYYKNLSESRMDEIFDNFIKSEFLGSGFPLLSDRVIQKINKPTLLVLGQNSPKIFLYLQKRLSELIPYAELEIVKDSSHISHEDNPLGFCKTVVSFIRKNTPRQKVESDLVKV
ncbi:alpha/beta fold hydrolase [Membranihabitans marinus]|uniref:alpha/beta fold hydrolase n=1 Tax=Membranihabitans marinus TaxID=1227546 RepID=UPI001F2F3CC2|nr:alpha/beta hydrolase [Membranihabitans marinus]